MYRIRALSAVIIAAMLTACGSGGGGGSALPTSPSHSTSAGARGSIKITLAVPPSKAQSARAIAYLQQQQSSKLKRRYYLSGATTEIDFTLSTENGVAASPADQAQYDFAIYTSSSSECTGNNTNGYSCTITAPAPVGADTYVVQSQQCSVANSGPSASCSSLGGTLTLLSASYTAVNVVLDQTVVAAFTLSPIVASIDWATVTYANLAGSSPMNHALWLPQPNGTASPTYNATANSYACSSSVGSGTGNGCFEPAAQGTQIAYGEVLEARDANGAIIVGASGGTVYQTPLYLDATGNPITINWTCTDNVTGASVGTTKTVPSVVWETGGGPYPSNASVATANQSFNSPVSNPASDPDGGNTVDGNGNPVTAVGNNGLEMNWDGLDQPLLASPDPCSASTSNGLSTSVNFYLGLGQGGISVTNALPDGNLSLLSQSNASFTSETLTGYNAGAFGSPVSTNVQNYNNVYPYGVSNAATYDSHGNLWTLASYGVTQSQSDAVVTEYAGSPASSATPTNTFTVVGPAVPGYETWSSIAVDAQGDVYLADGQQNEIDVFPAGTTGTVSPAATIAGSNTALSWPTKLSLDSSGNLWVYDWGTGPYTIGNKEPASGTLPIVYEFSAPSIASVAAGGTGNIAPIQGVFDGAWQASCGYKMTYSLVPGGITFDPAGNLILSFEDGSGPSGTGNLVNVFPAGFTHTTCATTGFNDVNGVSALAVDDHGYVYVATNTGLDVFPESATNSSSGFATPYASIADPAESALTGFALWTESGWFSGNAIHRHNAAKR